MKEEAELGERVARWDGCLYPSVSSISRSVVLPPSLWAPCPATIHLPAAGSWRLRPHVFNEYVCVCQLVPFRWGPQTNMSTYQTSLINFSTAGKWEKGCNAKKKQKNPKMSKAWKVISNRTCQEGYGRFTQLWKRMGRTKRLALQKRSKDYRKMQ